MSAHIDPEELYDTLVAEGLFEVEGERLQLSDDFVSARERYRSEVANFDDDTYASRLAEYVEDTTVSADDLDDQTFADAIAIHETTETIDSATSVHVALSLDRSEEVEEDPHIPSGFVTLSGEEIEPFLQAHPASIIYCWREDCDPCDAVRDHLEELRRDGTIPEEVGLGAIYGPDNATVLYEEYEVGASPTMLFCSGNDVESRYVGNPGPQGLRHEIEVLVEDM